MIETTSVVAQDAPVGVLLWPVREAKYEPGFTLAEVHVIRNEARTFVCWVYQDGHKRYFDLDENVVVSLRKETTP